MRVLTWSDQEEEFIREHARTHTYAEIAEAIGARFGTCRTKRQVGYFVSKNGIRNGIGTWPAGRPSRRLPIGAESILGGKYDNDPYRYITVKTADGWRYKHHVVWEEANGGPIPADCQITFADGDKRNFDPENLVAVPKRVIVKINQMGLLYHDTESLKTCMAIAELKMAVNQRNNVSRSYQKENDRNDLQDM